MKGWLLLIAVHVDPERAGIRVSRWAFVLLTAKAWAHARARFPGEGSGTGGEGRHFPLPVFFLSAERICRNEGRQNPRFYFDQKTVPDP